MRYGAIYIAHNPRDGESLYKVGKTERLIDERMKELTSSTSNLGTYSAKAYFIVAGIDEAEKACHKRLGRYRVQSNREFFDIPLERLVQIVKEVLEPFLANSYYPGDKGQNIELNLGETDPIQKLREIRKNNQTKGELWETALGEAIQTVGVWFEDLTSKATDAKQNLHEETSLSWEIPDVFKKQDFHDQYQSFCSVTVHARFKETPLELLITGYIMGTPPKLYHEYKKGGEWTTWKEVDDGRLGRIDIRPVIENSREFDKEQGRLPTIKVSVQATPITYDDYHCRYAEKYSKEKVFSNPEEAFEVFLALVLNNIAEPQFDIRKRGSSYKSRDGTKRTNIRDYGKFHLKELEGA